MEGGKMDTQIMMRGCAPAPCNAVLESHHPCEFA